MAIFSLHHTAIGKTTQARPHTAAAHVRYISRPKALGHLEARRCPAKPAEAMRYLREEEDRDRANARVADKLMLALPRELSKSQRIALVAGYAESITKGRAPWLAAFHDKGKDADNPHCHLILRDRDPKTGRRVIQTSEPGSTERFRQAWERHANQALKMAGREERIDRRTLRAQGIDREPTIHEGPRAQEMDARGAKHRSKVREARNAPGARNGTRKVDYRDIDQGRSRPAYNRMIRARETESDYWAAIDADQRQREFEDLGHGEDVVRQRKEEQSRHQTSSDSGKPAVARVQAGAKRPRKGEPQMEAKDVETDRRRMEVPANSRSFSGWLKARPKPKRIIVPRRARRRPDRDIELDRD